jgi:hypothetical protein
VQVVYMRIRRIQIRRMMLGRRVSELERLEVEQLLLCGEMVEEFWASRGLLFCCTRKCTGLSLWSSSGDHRRVRSRFPLPKEIYRS